MELCDLDVYADKCFMKKLNSRCVMVESVIRVEPYFEDPKYEYWDDDWDWNVKLILAARKNVIASGQPLALNIKKIMFLKLEK